MGETDSVICPFSLSAAARTLVSSRSVPEIHQHVAGTLSNQPTNSVHSFLLRFPVSADGQGEADESTEPQLTFNQSNFTIPSGESQATQNLTVTCRPPAWVTKLLALKIKRTPVQGWYTLYIAYIWRGYFMNQPQLIQNREGWSVSGDFNEKYLTLTITNPKCSDGGTYVCWAQFEGQDPNAQYIEATKSAVVTVQGEK